jgi:hypothetical protein
MSDEPLHSTPNELLLIERCALRLEQRAKEAMLAELERLRLELSLFSPKLSHSREAEILASATMTTLVTMANNFATNLADTGNFTMQIVPPEELRKAEEILDLERQFEFSPDEDKKQQPPEAA